MIEELEDAVPLDKKCITSNNFVEARSIGSLDVKKRVEGRSKRDVCFCS